jgi:hypothetical protein
MEPDLAKKLFDDFPDILNKSDDPTKSCMFWGIDCGDGWYLLLRELCEEIRAICKERPGTTCRAAQVKEKFGGLRFYVDILEPDDEESLTFDRIHEKIGEYERKSTTICEKCGAAGQIRKMRWIMTLCDKHFDEVQLGATKAKLMRKDE